jgi:hypothetical protein
MEFHILKFLYNYFIMHDIKYFFLNKYNQTIQGGKIYFRGKHITENIIKKHYFLKFGGSS